MPDWDDKQGLTFEPCLYVKFQNSQMRSLAERRNGEAWSSIEGEDGDVSSFLTFCLIKLINLHLNKSVSARGTLTYSITCTELP